MPPAAPPPRKARPWLLAIGWLLTLPGLWVITSLILLAPVSGLGGCAAPSGLSFPPCPPGPWAALADSMRLTVALTAILSFVGIGAVPPLYTLTFAATRLALWIGRHGSGGDGGRGPLFGFLMVLGLVVVGSMVATIASSSPQPGEVASGLLGLGAMVGVFYGGYRLIRWGIRRLTSA
ncbi:hypothetical protein E8L99_21215 [Phreatobacter aquaticus]|uniref:Uncharacterized protein n=1 Tax=Phreatobacter aquaticus TaxID=2570229 RepID=A0A4D7QSS7_9HYPH|nr:hypothetical protein [Phreatobacter aquaticus]QCK88097.1 hypothetical protein E8L99_21215 [Phreatobacter aquaticus]